MPGLFDTGVAAEKRVLAVGKALTDCWPLIPPSLRKLLDRLTACQLIVVVGRETDGNGFTKRLFPKVRPDRGFDFDRGANPASK